MRAAQAHRTYGAIQLRNQPPLRSRVVADRGEEGPTTEMLCRPRHALSLAPSSRCYLTQAGCPNKKGDLPPPLKSLAPLVADDMQRSSVLEGVG